MPGNAWYALASALGGAGKGLAGGLQDVRESRERRDQRQMAAEQFAQQLAENRQHSRIMEEQGQSQIDAANSWHTNDEFERSRHNQLAEAEAKANTERQELNDYTDNQAKVGVVFNDPRRARDAMRAADFDSPGFLSRSQVATDRAISTNTPRQLIEGSEGFGGAYSLGHPFDPNSYQADRVSGSNLNTYADAVSAARRRIEQVRNDTEKRFKEASGIDQLVDTQAIRDMENHARGVGREAAHRTAQAEARTLHNIFARSGYQELSPEELLGEAVSAPQPGAAGPGQPGANPYLNRTTTLPSGGAPTATPAAAPAAAPQPASPPAAGNPYLKSQPKDTTRTSRSAAAALDTANRDLGALVPEVADSVQSLVRAAAQQGVKLTPIETRRSQERQDYLYAQGRTRPGPQVTWTLKSNHTPGAAVDFMVNDDTSGKDPGFQWLQLNAPRFGFKVLGPSDLGHVEMPEAVNRAVPGAAGGNPYLQRRP